MNSRVKYFLKILLDIIFIVINIPLLVFHYFFGLSGNRDSVFWAISQFLSLFPGMPGNYLRKNFYRFLMTKCNKECVILFGTIFSHVDTEIGEGVYIGPDCNIGKSRIEDNCTLGSNVHIISGRRQHNFDDLDAPVQEQGGTYEKVIIGEDAWIGNCAIIMANLGKKCIVGAGSVVTKDVEDFSVVAGNPARLIRKRK